MMYAIDDVRRACANFECWAYLASKQIQFEYRRNFLGSFWIAFGFGLTAVGIGAVMAQLQGREFATHIPYVMFGFAAWTFILQSVQSGCNVLVGAKPYLLQMPMARTNFILSATLRNAYLFSIHIVTAIIIALALGWHPTFMALYAIPACGTFIAAGIGTGLLLGHVCARYPDLGQLINAVMRLAFFFTPIIWVAEDSERGSSGGFIGFLMTWNPFTYFMNTFRDAMLGSGPDFMNWVVTLSATSALLVLGALALQLMGRRITYWL